MKRSILFLTAVAAVVFFGCKETPYINAPSNNSSNLDTAPVLKADTNGIVISVDSAIAICHALVKDGETAERYKISGELTSIKTDATLVPSTYTNIDFTLSDNGGNITCFRSNYLNNYPFRSRSEIPAIGTKLTVSGTLCNYNGNTPEVKNCFIVRIDAEPAK